MNKLELLQKITDLEAKLAESENALEAKESVNRMYKATLSLKDSDFSDLVRENTKLKQQIAEKEKEIEELRFENRNILPLIKSLEEKVKEDKISFVVEQLEKVKSVEQDYYDLIDLRNRIKEGSDGDVRLYEEDAIILDHILDYIERINNQIKQLKESQYEIQI